MNFSSTIFIFAFLPLVLALYYLIPNNLITLRNALLLSASLLFYAWGEPTVVFVMLFSIIINYGLGLLLGGLNNTCSRRIVIGGAIIINLGMLGYYKYINFLIDTINRIFDISISPVNVVLPIGISFFTFQILSYVIDVYWNNTKPQRNILSLALYISFFPQLIAGPIVRYTDIEGQLPTRSHSVLLFGEGIRRFILGFGKKVLIANNVANYADFAFEGTVSSASVAWIGALAYMIQIYFDFSGYSDMAIGLGKMFGFHFNENFNYPYSSTSIRSFWRRWHISLSSWFRDYLYIPLGGNRRGTIRTYINLAIVFLVTGLWHGAQWTFVVWGLYHGVFLIVERVFLHRYLSVIPKALTWLYSTTVVFFGWVLFRAESLSAAGQYYSKMFDFTNWRGSVALAHMDWIILGAMLLGIVLSIPVLRNVHGKISHYITTRHATKTSVLIKASETAGLLCIFIISIVFLVGSDFNPFLYFRF